MPTYDYKCSFCSNVFEVFHGIKESPDINCPECSNRAKKRISLNSGLIFKGSGFYITDYKKNSISSSTPEKSETKSVTKPKTEKKSEKKELKADA